MGKDEKKERNNAKKQEKKKRQRKRNGKRKRECVRLPVFALFCQSIQQRYIAGGSVSNLSFAKIDFFKLLKYPQVKQLD